MIFTQSNRYDSYLDVCPLQHIHLKRKGEKIDFNRHCWRGGMCHVSSSPQFSHRNLQLPRRRQHPLKKIHQTTTKEKPPNSHRINQIDGAIAPILHSKCKPCQMRVSRALKRYMVHLRTSLR